MVEIVGIYTRQSLGYESLVVKTLDCGPLVVQTLVTQPLVVQTLIVKSFGCLNPKIVGCPTFGNRWYSNHWYSNRWLLLMSDRWFSNHCLSTNRCLVSQIVIML